MSDNIFSEFTQDGASAIDFSKFLGLLKDNVLAERSLPFADLLNSLQSLAGQLDSGIVTNSLGSSASVSSMFGDSLLGSTMGKFADESVLQIMAAADSLANGLADKLTGALLSKLHMPELIFLASVKSMYIAGGDPNLNNNYLRSVALKKDLAMTLEWLDEINKVSYITGTSNEKLNDALTAAKNSCVRVVKYIFECIKTDLTILDNMLKASTDDMEYVHRMREDLLSHVYGIVKALLINAYSNLTVLDISYFVELFDLKPVVFGETDYLFSKKYMIRETEIDKMAPMKMDEFGNSYILPKNKNIKRIYLYLSNPGRFGNDKLSHTQLHKRMEYKTYSTMMEAVDAATKELLKEGAPWDSLMNLVDTKSSIYQFTKTNEKLLYDPSNVEYIRFADRKVIPPVSEQESADEMALKESCEKELANLLVYDDVENSQLPVSSIDVNDFQKTISNYTWKLRGSQINTTIRELVTSIKNDSITDASFTDRNLIGVLYRDIWLTKVYPSDFSTWNLKQLLPYVISDIKDNLITDEVLQYKSVYTLLADQKAALITGGTYTDTPLGTDELEVYKRSVYKLDELLMSYLKGEISKSSIPDATQLTRENAGLLIPQNKNFAIDYALITVINKYVADFIEGDITKDQFPSLVDMISEGERLIKNNSNLGLMNFSLAEVEIMQEKIKEYINQIKIGLITIDDLPSLTLVSEMVKAESGTGTTSSDPDDYYAKLDALVDLDPSFYNIDINDPSAIDSINKEITDGKNLKYKVFEIQYIPTA